MELVEAVRRQTKPKLFEARYSGRCRWCGASIEVGQVIAHSSMPLAKFTLHCECLAEAWLLATKSGGT